MNRGFTLIEVLVALGILAVVMAIVGATFAGALRVQEAADRRTEVTHAARTALDRVSQDLASAFPKKGEGPGGLVLEDRELDGVAADRLTFATFGRPIGGVADRASDQALIEYELVVSDDRRERRLVRRQVSPPDQEALAKAPADVLAERVVAFDVKLFDASSKAWKAEWREAAKLPQAAEITLRIASDGGSGTPRAFGGEAPGADVRTYGTRLTLPLAKLQ